MILLQGIVPRMSLILMLVVLDQTGWQVLCLTGEVYEVSPYLPTYDAVKEITVARCGTVWTLPSNWT